MKTFILTNNPHYVMDKQCMHVSLIGGLALKMKSYSKIPGSLSLGEVLN